MPRQRGSSLIVVLAAAVLVLIGAIIYSRSTYLNTHLNIAQPTKIAPQTKITYTDSDLGFSLTYTNDYSLIADNEDLYFKRKNTDFRKNFTDTWNYSPPDFIKGIVIKSISNTQDQDLAPFTLWVFDNPHSLTAGQWYDDYWYYPFVWGEYEPKKSQQGPDLESSVSGQLANIKIIDYQPGSPKFVYVPYKNKMYLFRIIQSSNVGDEILASFKFAK